MKLNPIHIVEVQEHLELPSLSADETRAFFVCLDKYLRDTGATHRYEINGDGEKILCMPVCTQSVKISSFITGYLMALGVDEDGNRL